MKRQTFRVSALSVATVAALALSACGSSGSSTSTGSGTSASTGASASGSAAAATNISYSGPEEHYQTLSAPTVKAGTKCTIGYQDIIESVPAQKAEQDAAGAEAAKLGCKYIALDDQVTPTTQVNNFNQLVAQKVSAIIVFPIVASSLTPSLAKAKAAGIFVLGQSAPVAAGDKPIPGYSTNMLHMSDTEAYLRVKSVAAAKPGASFAEMGLAAPVELLQYYAARTKYWAAKFGLHYLGEIDAATDNPAGYSQAASAILAKYPTMQALMTFSDNSAVGAAAVVRSSGKSGILISGADGSEEAFNAIKAGTVFNSPQPDFLASGRMLVDAAYDLITKQNLPLPADLGVPVKLITKENVDSSAPIG
ncbi:MAG TPA: sugar ABC transporter substrate-binding protein [Streptosporangiaceae bacterium]|nr:sugar ABC transporter substrate-binding protein [Streptosporangiaceae bacterium]